MRSLGLLLAVLLSGSELFAQDPDYTLKVLDNSDGDSVIGVSAGDLSVRVDIVLDFPNGMPVDAWQFGLCHDGGIVNLPGTNAPSPLANNVLNPQEFGAAGITGPVFPAFATDAVYDDGPGGGIDGFTAAAVMDFLLVATLPAQTDALVAVAFYDVLQDPGAGSPLEFCSTIRFGFLIGIQLIVGQTALVPTVEDGMFVTAAPTVIGDFFRGECDQSGDYDLADGIFLLNSINNSGANPACPDSCDFNADGMMTVMDAVASFAYLFIGGSAPLAPFPACDAATLLVDPICVFDASLCA